MKPPKVSIVIGAYNCERTIQETVYSVINQTFKDWELIVVDDCSNDNTVEELKAIKAIDDCRISIIRTNENSGLPAVARNIGIKISKGEFIAFLDHDDIWFKQKLATQLPYFQSPKIIGVASDAALIAETPYYRKINWGRSKLGHIDYQYKDILTHNPIITSSLVVRREALEAAGLFDEDRDLFCIEDWELWLKMARFGLFRVLEKPLLSYRVSRKRSAKAAIISTNCLKILEKQVNLGYVEDKDIREPKVLVYLAIARNLLEFDQQQSRKYYFKALKATSNLRRKIKSCTGILISFFPPCFKKTTLLVLYKTDLILCSLKDRSREIIKIFCRVRHMANKSMLNK